MRRAVGLALLCAIVGGCGSEPAKIASLALASSYDLIGVRRDFPDGLTVTAHAPYTLALEGVVTSGDGARARLVTMSSSAAIAISGSFDPTNGRLTFDPTAGAVWTPRIDTIDGIGGTALDGTPRDGLANEIVGFVQTSTGQAQFEASFLAVAQRDDAVTPIDPARVTIEIPELGLVRIIGTAGAAPPAGGIEVFRHQLIERDAAFTLDQAMDDGSFDISVSGFTNDIFLVRPRVAGRAGTGIALRAQ